MIVLDGRKLADRAALHSHLRERLALPDYYGGNLDALNDCLGELCERPLVVVGDSGAFLSECGPYGLRLLQVFADNGIQVLLD